MVRMKGAVETSDSEGDEINNGLGGTYPSSRSLPYIALLFLFCLGNISFLKKYYIMSNLKQNPTSASFHEQHQNLD